MAELAAVYNDNPDHSFIHGYLHAKTRRQWFSFWKGFYLFYCHIIFYQREAKESFIVLVHNDNQDHLFIQDYLHANTLSLMHTAVLTCMFYRDNVSMFTPSRMDNWFDEIPLLIHCVHFLNVLIYFKGSFSQLPTVHWFSFSQKKDNRCEGNVRNLGLPSHSVATAATCVNKPTNRFMMLMMFYSCTPLLRHVCHFCVFKTQKLWTKRTIFYILK